MDRSHTRNKNQKGLFQWPPEMQGVFHSSFNESIQISLLVFTN